MAKLTVQFAGSIPRSQKKAVLRVVKKAKTVEEVADYTREQGLWLLVSAYYKTLIIWG